MRFIFILIGIALVFVLQIPIDHAFVLLIDFVLALSISSLYFCYEEHELDKALGNDQMPQARKKIKEIFFESLSSLQSLSLLSSLGIIFFIIAAVFGKLISLMPSIPNDGKKELVGLFSEHFKYVELSKLSIEQLFTVGTLLMFSRGSQRGDGTNLAKKLEQVYASETLIEKAIAKQF
jgi:hypothetical protein